MKLISTFLKSLIFLLLAYVFTFCAKEDDPVNTDDPSNLKIEVLFINHETGFVQIQAIADNANLYQFYIGAAMDPEEVNPTGYFEYTFDGQGTYTFSIRAYGASGKYLKKDKEIVVAYEAEDVPLSRGFVSPEEYAGYNLVWQDEFNGTQLNSSNWTHETGNGSWGWGNNELEYYRSENTTVGDSVLTIEARSESYGGFDYTSSRMKTQGKYTFQYGRVDIRALLPKGQGMWPALWMLGENITQVSWPDCGEIDIMEMIGGSENIVHGTAHWEYNSTHASSGGSKSSSGNYNYAESYHVFSIVWDENLIKWYVDGQQYYVLDITGADMTEFHQPNFFIINLAVGGNWPGSPNTSTIFPQQLKVDYIRVFQEE